MTLKLLFMSIRILMVDLVLNVSIITTAIFLLFILNTFHDLNESGHVCSVALEQLDAIGVKHHIRWQHFSQIKKQGLLSKLKNFLDNQINLAIDKTSAATNKMIEPFW